MLPLALENVSFTIGGKAIIDRISAEFGVGPRTAILGPNGAGKSVLMRLCHGLLKPTTGSIVWRGPNAPDGNRRQAMVFQRPVMLRRSALANIVYALKLAGVPPGEREPRALDVLDAVDLLPLAHRPARVLSGGEQQKLALARVWALGPEVLFLDEPTANLDPGATRDIEAIIAAIHATGTKIIMNTHNLGQARRLGDEIVFLYGGRLIERALVADFFAAPVSAEARQFIRGELPWQ